MVTSVAITISSIKQLNWMNVLENNKNDTSEMEQYATVCSNKLLNRLHCFLRTRIPVNRIDVLPGQNCKWDSLRS